MKLKLLLPLLAFSIVSTITSAEAPQPCPVIGLRAIRQLDGSYEVQLTVRNSEGKNQYRYVNGKVQKLGDELYFTFITNGGHAVKQVIDGKTELRLIIGSCACLVTTRANNALARLGKTPPLTKWGILPANK